MSSKSTEQVTDETTNLAIDRRAVLEQGTQVLDSGIYDTSSADLGALLDAMTAQWGTMVQGNALNLLEVLNLGEKFTKLVDEQQFRINEQSYQTLKAGMDQFRLMADQGDLVVRLADNLADRALDLADDTTSRALDVVADVKTGDFKSLSAMVLAFAALAIFLTTRGAK